jgi:hypothetical protein
LPIFFGCIDPKLKEYLAKGFEFNSENGVYNLNEQLQISHKYLILFSGDFENKIKSNFDLKSLRNQIREKLSEDIFAKRFK